MTQTRAVHPDVERVLLDTAAVQARIQELGAQITRDYAGKKPVFIGILKGGVMFLADLLRAADLDCQVDFMCLASYSGASSSGVVRLLLDLRESITDRDVLVVEDIVDTGLTLSYLLQNLKTRRPRSLEICTLLDKAECRKVRVEPKYVGFKIPNEFVVGYGLDFEEAYRNLPYIGVLKKSAAEARSAKA
ncbi:MAG TPA: hypoxanthine phosphoribosyltransferase [Elusimicrobiota bacterium]|jgi:hypoxanthine phosphoribosyltransferase|nr:hypoxanthine phosphoribosyltransferase [Elusimicrobiota bacterium]